MLFHISPVTGDPKVCAALNGNCPFADASGHYPDEKTARAAFEATQDTPFAVRLTKAEDAYSRRFPKLLAAMVEHAPDAYTKAVYKEALETLGSDRRFRMQRFQEVYRHRGDRAFDAKDTVSGTAYYMLYRAAGVLREYRYQMNRLEEQELAVSYQLARGQEPSEREKLEKRMSGIQEDRTYWQGRMEEQLQQVSTSTAPVHRSDLFSEELHMRGFTMREFDGARGDLREALEDADATYVGRITQEERSAALHQLEEDSQVLAFALTRGEGNGSLASLDNEEIDKGPVVGAEDFELIAGGGENNVYLHRPSMIVYKVRHSVGLDVELEESEEAMLQQRRRVAVIRLQEEYEKLDKGALQAINASYLKTYFLSPQGEAGQELSMIAQPFLDPQRYGAYEAGSDELSYLKSLGLNDLHSGNVSVDSVTGNIVLYDCIYTAAPEL